MKSDTTIKYDEAVRAVACHLALGGPPTVTEYNKARAILWGCLSPEAQSERVLR